MMKAAVDRFGLDRRGGSAVGPSHAPPSSGKLRADVQPREDEPMTRALVTAALLCLNGMARAEEKLVYPIIPNVGGVVSLPDAAESPRKGARVVFDITADAKPADLNKGLERVARLLNLYGSAGLQASDVKVALVVHGEATKSVLSHDVYRSKFATDRNPNLALIGDLRKAGVEVFVCGQALAHRGFERSEVSEGVRVASAALTVVINRQADGYSYVPVP
jgi:intracellular sulfur oxidation DsrE/DsrF family protein